MPTAEQAALPSRAVPMQISTPPSLEWLTRCGEMDLLKLDPETRLKPETVQAMKAHLADLQAYLAPARPDWIVERISALMGHWWSPSLPEDQLRIMALDWVKALQDQPQFALEEGIARFLKEHRRKPLPADILKESRAVTEAERQMVRRITEALRPRPKWAG